MRVSSVGRHARRKTENNASQTPFHHASSPTRSQRDIGYVGRLHVGELPSARQVSQDAADCPRRGIQCAKCGG